MIRIASETIRCDRNGKLACPWSAQKIKNQNSCARCKYLGAPLGMNYTRCKYRSAMSLSPELRELFNL